MTAAIIFLLLVFLYPLLAWIWGHDDDANERIAKDEKYSFKKMNEEINEQKTAKTNKL